jgi:hypothetical protein
MKNFLIRISWSIHLLTKDPEMVGLFFDKFEIVSQKKDDQGRYYYVPENIENQVSTIGADRVRPDTDLEEAKSDLKDSKQMIGLYQEENQKLREAITELKKEVAQLKGG